MRITATQVKEAAERTGKIVADFCAVTPKEEPDDHLEAWRISFTEDDSAVSCVFASERDVWRVIGEMAKRGIVDIESYEAAPEGTVSECIAAALPW